MLKSPSTTSMLYLGTDGGATKNGKSGCVCSYAAVLGTETERLFTVSGLIKENATNNVGELTAILRGLEAAREHIAGYSTITVLSDSMYSINCITVWYKSWVAKNALSDKKNVALIKSIVEVVDAYPIPITFKHVRGHAVANGTLEWKYNDECDRECNRLLEPFRPGKK